jgi:hypothetical protein
MRFIELPAFFDFIHSHNSQLNDNAFHFDHQPDIAAEVQDKIDWDLIKGQGALLPSPSLSLIFT